MTKRKAIICDLDGTLCDHSRRQKFIPVNAEDRTSWKNAWDKYHSGLVDDPVIEATQLVLEVFNRVPNDSWHGELTDVIIVTGRPSIYSHDTRVWLKKHDIEYDKIFMRGMDDRMSDADLKRDIYVRQIQPHYDVKLVIDDRDSVVKMWRDLGLTCFQACEGAY